MLYALGLYIYYDSLYERNCFIRLSSVSFLQYAMNISITNS